MPAKYEQFQFTNPPKRLNRLAQIVLATTFIGGLNYLATEHYWRKDLTAQARYTLSAETRAHIDQIDPENPVNITVTLTPDTRDKVFERLYHYVDALLKEYAYAGRDGDRRLINVRRIDIYRERAEAERLQKDYDINSPQVVVVECGERFVVLDESKLVELRNQEIDAFKGERALTTAIVEVSRAEPKKVYFTTGNLEMRLDDVGSERGLSLLRTLLERQGYQVAVADLAAPEGVPEDADLVVVAAPRGPFDKIESTRLREFLGDRAGRVIVVVEPAQEHGLDGLLLEWGLRADDMVVVDSAGPKSHRSGLMQVVDFTPPHSITEFLSTNRVKVELGLARPARPDPDAPADERLTRAVLMKASQGSWAERAYRRRGTWVFDEATDLAGPVPLAAVSERKVPPELGLDLRGGRLLLFGSADLIANRGIVNIGNAKLFQNAVGWCLDEDSLLGIKPRPIERFKLAVDDGQIRGLWLTFLSVPGAVALAGIFVFWIRRS